jgi:hypothetical protein
VRPPRLCEVGVAEAFIVEDQVGGVVDLGVDLRIGLNQALAGIAQGLWRQVEVLRRIPEKMDPGLFF